MFSSVTLAIVEQRDDQHKKLSIHLMTAPKAKQFDKSCNLIIRMVNYDNFCTITINNTRNDIKSYKMESKIIDMITIFILMRNINVYMLCNVVIATFTHIELLASHLLR